jgi:hypothetical protein
MKARQPFAAVKKWRASGKHTGIGKTDGIPCLYRHLPGRTCPSPRAEVYRVETFLPFTDIALHGNVHFVPGSKLDAFFDSWGEYAETLLDVRPMTTAEALAEIAAYRAAAESAGQREADPK